MAFSFLTFSCNNLMSQKYEWYPTTCQINLYPMEIVAGQFVLPGQTIVRIPQGHCGPNGWGSTGPTELVGPEQKPLPASLQLLWFSYIENKFYQGNFPLPTEALAKIMKEDFTNANADGLYHIVVGCAPGGNVSVWIKAGQITTEVGFFKADAVDYDWKKFSGGLNTSREDYIATALHSALDSSEMKIASIPLGWKGKYDDDYRKKYSLSVTNNVEAQTSDALISYFDGSGEYRLAQPAANKWSVHQTIPKRILWHWKSKSGKELGTEINFDEAEIFDAFKKLNSEHPHAPLTLHTEIVSTTVYEVSLVLKNQFGAVALKKCEASTYEW